MKRFKWRLQRVLDITEQRERALRAEIAALAGLIRAVRDEIRARHALVRRLLDDLGRRSLAERMAEQAVIMACAAAEKRILAALEARRAELQAQRDAKTQQYLATRAARRTLERLREEARRRFQAEMSRLEQKELDEAAHIAFARRNRPRMVAVPV